MLSRALVVSLMVLVSGCQRPAARPAEVQASAEVRPSSVDLPAARQALEAQQLTLAPELVQKALPQLEAAVQRQLELEEQVRRAPGDLALTLDLSPGQHKALALALQELVTRERLRRVTLVSDETWRFAVGSNAGDGWQRLDFDDSTWRPAVAQGRLGVSPWQPVMGFAAPSNAEWIWHYASNQGDDQTSAVFRRRFVPSRAELTMTITADNEFEAFVDGVSIASGRDWQQSVSVPVRLKAGAEHVLAVKVVNWGGPGGLLVDLR